MVISLRGSVPRITTKAMLAYHTIGCGIAIIMVTYVIRIEPGTYAHSEPKSNKVKKEITGSRLVL